MGSPEWKDLIGIPFAYGGRGPDTFDCYGLVRELHKRMDQDIPDYKSPHDAARITALMMGELRLWEQVEQGVCAVPLIRVTTRSGEINLHVGFMVDRFRMIHTWEDSGGVVVERIEQWQRRILGFYRYVGK
jgi:cell wall-associated NlpC family hydrolase